MLKAHGWVFRCLDEAQVLPTVKIEVPVDETEKVIALFETYRGSSIAEPAVELGTNAVKVFGLCALLTLTNLGSVLAAKPCLKTIRLDLLASIVQLTDAVSPPCVCRAVRLASSIFASRYPLSMSVGLSDSPRSFIVSKIV